MKVAACLLIKNEEELLLRCLNSVVEHVDEICIIDNGSTDKSIEIASQYTDNINYCYSNKFDVMRNSFGLYTDADWILSIDADEELCCLENFKKIIISSPDDVLGIRIPRLDYIGNAKWAQNFLLRLYRNNKKIKYSNASIHSSLRPSIESLNGKILLTDKVFIHHFDALSKCGSQHQKRQRYLKELKKQIESFKYNDNELFSYYCFLALEYVYLKEFDLAFSYLEAADSLNFQEYTTAKVIRAQIYLLNCNYKKAYEIAMEILRVNCCSLQAKNILIQYYFYQCQYDKIKELYSNTLKFPHEFFNLAYIEYIQNGHLSFSLLDRVIELNPYIINKKIYKTCVESIFSIQCVCLPYDQKFLEMSYSYYLNKTNITSNDNVI